MEKCYNHGSVGFENRGENKDGNEQQLWKWANFEKEEEEKCS